VDKVVGFLSGEFLLLCRPNGGTVVLLRSLWIATLIFLIVLPLKSYFAPNTILVFSAAQLKIEIGEMIPWFGAIFAAAYVALYSRFAAQWGYLASLYNQMMASFVALPIERRRGNETLANWRAAFVEDALDLHLSEKAMFRGAIISLLQDGEVVRAFLDSTNNGSKRLKELEKKMGFAAAAPSNPEFKSCASIIQATNGTASAPR